MITLIVSILSNTLLLRVTKVIISILGIFAVLAFLQNRGYQAILIGFDLASLVLIALGITLLQAPAGNQDKKTPCMPKGKIIGTGFLMIGLCLLIALLTNSGIK